MGILEWNARKWPRGNLILESDSPANSFSVFAEGRERAGDFLKKCIPGNLKLFEIGNQHDLADRAAGLGGENPATGQELLEG
jgi:hypothetical protein